MEDICGIDMRAKKPKNFHQAVQIAKEYHHVIMAATKKNAMDTYKEMMGQMKPRKQLDPVAMAPVAMAPIAVSGNSEVPVTGRTPLCWFCQSPDHMRRECDKWHQAGCPYDRRQSAGQPYGQSRGRGRGYVNRTGTSAQGDGRVGRGRPSYSGPRDTVTCGYCKKIGHPMINCRQKAADEDAAKTAGNEQKN